MTKLILSLLISISIGQLFSQQDSSYAQLLEELYVAGPGFSAIVAQDGEILFHGTIGLADIENDIEIQPDHVFRLGSITCLLYTSPSPRDRTRSRMPSSA